MRATARRVSMVFAATVLATAAGLGLGAGFAAAAPAPLPLTSASCPVDIAEGQVSGCVTELQTLLDQHGAAVAVDGNFGPGTYAAVRTFQSETGLGIDGIAGPATKARLVDTGGSVPAPIDLRLPSCPVDIAEGQISGCVTELQDLLNRSGAHISVDGNFGAGTLGAVETFQRAHGLGADGIVGPGTRAALYGTTPTPSPVSNLNSSACPYLMRQGEVDGCVTELQSLLSAHGHPVGVDGNFGPGTRAAVVAFQTSALGGAQADGIVGPLTKAALYGNVSGSGGNGAPAPVNLTAAACPALIRQGENDGCVTELQSLLNRQGAHLAVDGSFGPLTLAAVETFQAGYGIGVDGIVGSQTKAALYGTLPKPGPAPAPGASAAAAAALAQANVGGTACGTNTRGGRGFTNSCTGYGGRPEYWCADFAIWVWSQTGLPVGGLTAAAGSFYVYGQQHGTLHTSGYRPQPGDAVVYNYGVNGYGTADHVGIVTAVGADGSVATANGDFAGVSGQGEAEFASTSHVVAATLSAAQATVGSTPSNIGMTISGYITPVGATQTGPAGPPAPTGASTLHSGFSVNTNLTRPSGLTVDFIRRFFIANGHGSSPLAGDGQLFLDAEHTYGVNAQYLVAHAIEESAWGTSNIAVADHNYFGNGAADSCPTTCAKVFASDQEGINYQAADVKQYYLTPGGQWYVSPTLAGMNVHYASDQSWASKIAQIADELDAFN